MKRTTLLIRTVLIAIFSSLSVFGILQYKKIARNEAAANSMMIYYDNIRTGGYEHTYHSIWDHRAFVVDVPKWPKTIGEITQYRQGFPRDIFSSDEKKFLIHPSTKLEWSVAVLPGKRVWIAIGYLDSGPRVRLIIDKKYGQFDPSLPEVKFIWW